MQRLWVSRPGVLEKDADRVVDHRLRIAGQARGELEAGRHAFVVVGDDEVQRCGDRRAAAQRLERSREVVQRSHRTAGEVTAEHARGGTVDHVPRRDPVVPAEVDVGELGAPRLVEASPSLEVEDAHRRHPRLVGRVVEQPIDFHQIEVGVRLGRGEQIAHADADRRLAGTESLADLGQLAVGLQLFELPHHGVSVGGHEPP